jgi:hypothetical protein
MKLAVLFSLALNMVIGIGLVLVLLHGGHPFVSAQGAPSGNGDVNGSGGIDIADTVYLLSYLFANGPAPVAFADGGGLTPEQEEILSHFSMVDLPIDDAGTKARTIRIEGVNVQIVNGKNRTDTTNGVGNLIVGYQEPGLSTNNRTGSHNLVVGTQQNYSSYGGFVAGWGNSISDRFASVSGGAANTASGWYASVSGGMHNAASGTTASVSGGADNTASGEEASVSGGRYRSATADYDWRAGEAFQDQ